MIVLVLGLPLSASSPADLPVNKWTRLPGKAEPGYFWSAPVYVPARGQLLHWGAVMQESRRGG